jgi:hypothetical protein
MGMASVIRKMITVKRLEVLAIGLISMSFVIFCAGVLVS